MRNITYNMDIFPYLEENIVIMVYKSFGIIKDTSDNINLKVTKETVDILSFCNGTKTLNEIFKHLFSTVKKEKEAEIYKALINILSLSAQGYILLSKKPYKTSLNIEKYDAIFFPESLHVELTSLCNLKCFYCYRNSSPRIKENRLPTNELVQIIENLSERGLQIVEITGGEPLLHPDFLTIVKRFAEFIEIIAILTNGTLLTEDIIKELLPLREKIVFSISLDSYLPEEHDRRSNVKGSHSRAVKAIKLLTKYKFFFRIAMAVDEINWKQIEKTLLFSKELGASKFSYSPIVPFGRGDEEFKFWDLSVDEVLKNEYYLQDKYKDFLFTVSDEIKEDVLNPGGCGAGYKGYAMDPQGNIRICATFDTNMGNVGSLYKQSPEEVFSNRIVHLSSKIPPPTQNICYPCTYTAFCLGCPLRGYKGASLIGKENCKWLQVPGVKEWCDLIENKISV